MGLGCILYEDGVDDLVRAGQRQPAAAGPGGQPGKDVGIAGTPDQVWRNAVVLRPSEFAAITRFSAKALLSG